jgi:hypothetical protein
MRVKMRRWGRRRWSWVVGFESAEGGVFRHLMEFFEVNLDFDEG